MAIARKQIRDFQEKSRVLGIGATSGFAAGILTGLIIGTYFFTKYNTMIIFDIAGLIISISTAFIWMIIVAVWTRKTTDSGVWLSVVGFNALCCLITCYIGYFIATLISILSVSLLLKIF